MEADFRVSPTLVPYDEDLDNDGIANLWDPHPLRADRRPASLPTHIPEHLQSRTASTRALQEKLWHTHRVLSIDHSDTLPDHRHAQRHPRAGGS